MAQQRDFLTDEIEIDRSPIPVYVDHVIIKRVYVTAALDTGLFYGYPDTPAMRRNYNLLQKVLEETCEAAAANNDSSETSVDPPRPGEIFGVKASLYGGDGDDMYYRCSVLDILGSMAKVCLVDFGDCLIADRKDLFGLTLPLINQPIACRLFRMAGVKHDRPAIYHQEKRTWFLSQMSGGKTVTVVPVVDGMIYGGGGPRIKKKIDIDSDPSVLVYTKEGVLVNDELRQARLIGKW